MTTKFFWRLYQYWGNKGATGSKEIHHGELKNFKKLKRIVPSTRYVCIQTV